MEELRQEKGGVRKARQRMEEIPCRGPSEDGKEKKEDRSGLGVRDVQRAPSPAAFGK